MTSRGRAPRQRLLAAAVALLLSTPLILGANGQEPTIDAVSESSDSASSLAQPDTASVTVEPAEVVGPPAGPARSGVELEEITDAVSKKMRCPVCQGLSVADSPSPSALAMRTEIGNLLEQGYSRQQVFDYFEGTYGEFVLLEPKAEGFNLTVWLAPIVLVALGCIAILTYVARSSARATASVEDDAALDAYRDRVRQELES